MKRKPMTFSHSRKVFKRTSGVHGMNRVNPRKFRGGIRL